MNLKELKFGEEALCPQVFSISTVRISYTNQHKCPCTGGKSPGICSNVAEPGGHSIR